MMKNFLLHIVLFFFMAASAVTCQATPQDTVYFYDTWEQMLNFTPDAVIIDPVIETRSPYELYVDACDDNINDLISNKHIALSLGDSIWLVNSKYLKRQFKGDTKMLNGYVPVFFNDKVAYVTYVRYDEWSVSLNDYLFGEVGYDGAIKKVVNYCYIDFMRRKVLKVDHSVLSNLLDGYHDLLMRYEGMKDYKSPEIIEEYFLKYVDRATEDIMRPNIVDLTE